MRTAEELVVGFPKEYDRLLFAEGRLRDALVFLKGLSSTQMVKARQAARAALLQVQKRKDQLTRKADRRVAETLGWGFGR